MKIIPEDFQVSDYLHHTFECNCGRVHSTQVEKILISKGALKELPDLLSQFQYRRPLLVADTNTYEVAGREAEELLKNSKISYTTVILEQTPLVPDEAALGRLTMSLTPDCDVILGVGTGTINDLCKYLSFQINIQCFSIATAPSMDGFASTGAALISGNLKTTYTTHAPQVIIGDLDILTKAPMAMIAAGAADILGKYTCLCDWHLARIVNGEYFCPVIEQMVRRSMGEVNSQIHLLKERSPETVKAVMEALVLTGIAMSFAGNSRPASGCEHHMSHYWEMKFLFEGRPAVLHGTKVGVGTATAVRLYQNFMEMDLDFNAAASKADCFDFEKWQQKMRRTFGIAAKGVIVNERSEKKNDPQRVKLRLSVAEERIGEIRETIARLIPPLSQIRDSLRELGAPVNPLELSIDRSMVRDSIEVAKEVRERYTLLQLLWDLGLLEEMAENAADQFEREFI